MTDPAAPATRPARAAGVAPQRRGFADDHPWYRFSRLAVRAALRGAADVRVSGMERCPPASEGGLILVSNHLNVTDIPLIGAWCHRAVLFFAKSEVRDWPVVGGVGQAYGQIFARRGEADRQAIRESLACLAAGQVLGIFPEGHRSHGAGLLRGQPGVSLLAARSGVRVWPVAVTGTEWIFRRPRPRVTLTGGEAFDPFAAARAEWGTRPDHQQVTDTIMRRVAALLPEGQRGAYRNPC